MSGGAYSKEVQRQDNEDQDRKGDRGADAAEQTIYFIEKLAACYALRTHFYIVARSERRELADQLADDIMALVRGAFQMMLRTFLR